MASESPPSRTWTLVDLGAAAAALLALGGVIWSPKLAGAVASATGAVKPVTVTVDVRGVPSADSAGLLRRAEEEGKVSLVIRNQPHGTVKVKRIQPLARRLIILTPEGKVVTAADPNQEVFGTFDGRFV
ncbi:MAG: DUF4330 domain-containing protein, partial [Synechococcaceae cyanobacterium]|nr:DUF4330 domain-containing protein [Synechococcaceae cyanobacterium]